jgi:shikimate dehydrogenase
VLLGRSLSHSLSPLFQNAALRQAQLPVVYETLDIPASALDDTLEQLERDEGAGNVTIPYKEKVFERCDRLSDTARRAEAVNTFWFERGELAGDNTDVGGFKAAAHRLLDGTPREITVGLLGAGGAAAAVLAAVESWPECTALVHNRTLERAEALCARFSNVAQPTDAATVAQQADIVVNATSVGLRDDALPIDPERLRPEAAVLDLVYRPGETAFVRAARARGLRAADGLAMLVEQGALAFERWFGFPPDREVMWASLR